MSEYETEPNVDFPPEADAFAGNTDFPDDYAESLAAQPTPEFDPELTAFHELAANYAEDYIQQNFGDTLQWLETMQEKQGLRRPTRFWTEPELPRMTAAR